ncbi:MAG: c-type cytochrome, partial [Parvularculaceae bacterium]|nr:c-type cytochrome [Parvularculaceae bacterium]
GEGVIAAPMSYAVDGVQHVAILAGFGGVGPLAGAIATPNRPRAPGKLYVFKIGGGPVPPPPAAPAPAPIDLAGLEGDGDPVAGRAAYNEFCFVCHSANASGGYLPDLRRSGVVRDAAVFRSVVIDGALKENGMASFAKYLSRDDAENIRAFIAAEARAEAARGAAPAP